MAVREDSAASDAPPWVAVRCGTSQVFWHCLFAPNTPAGGSDEQRQAKRFLSGCRVFCKRRSGVFRRGDWARGAHRSNRNTPYRRPQIRP